MAEIGTLEFIISTKDETSNTIDAIARKIQEMSNGINEAGSITDEQVKQMSASIQQAYEDIAKTDATLTQAIQAAENAQRNAVAGISNNFQDASAIGQQLTEQFRQQADEAGKVKREVENQRSANAKNRLELDKLKDALEQKTKKVGQSVSAEANLRRQMLEVRQEMQRQLQAAKDSGDATAEATLRASAEFQELQNRLGALGDTMDDVNMQMRILANDNAGLQGVIVGLQGLSGAMSAAQGIAGMFTKDQEALQQVMLKVQSTMAIANGLMQVANTLNQDSYFTLVILNRVKQAWASTSAEALAAQKAETAGTIKDTAAKGANSVATGVNTAAENAGTAARAKGLKGWIASRMAAANDTKAKIANAIAAKALTVSNGALAFSFRAVAVAIKSIPVVGWVLAGVGALVGILTALFNTSSEAEEQQEKLNEKIVESAAEPVASLSKLSAQYSLLGDNMQAKQKFIEDNKEEFDKLGISIASVSDAEEVLIQNKEKFIQAQIAKAAASAAYEELKEKAKELVEAEQELAEKDSDKRREAVQEAEDAMDELIGYAESKMAEADTLMGRFAANTQTISNKVAQKTGEGAAESIASLHRLAEQWKSLGGNIQKQNKFIAENKGEFDKLGLGIRNATDAENVLVKNKDKFVEAMTAKAESMAYFGLATDKFKEYIEAQMTIDSLAGKIVRMEATADEEAAFRNASQRAQQAKREAENLIKKGNAAAANASALNPVGTPKDDPFITNLNEKKKAYERYAKFVRSTDETLQAAAQGDEFKQLLEGGASYREYLENQIAEMEAAGGKTKAYRDHLAALYDELASIEKNTVIDDFRKALEQQLAAAQTQQEMLDIIAQNRKKLEDGGDVEVNKEKGDILDQQQKAIEDKEKERTNALLQQYSDYLTKKIQFEADYAENSRRLNQAITEAKTEDERKAYEQALAALNRQRERYANSTTTGDTDYDAMVAEYRSYEEQRYAIEQEYEEKIRIAREHNDEELIKKLEKSRTKSISDLTAQKLKDSDSFKNLFDNLDDLTADAIVDLVNQLQAEINSLKVGVDISPEEVEALKKKLKEALDKALEGKPFKALANAIAQFKADASSANLKNLQDAAANIADQFQSITGSLHEIADTMGSELLEKIAKIGDSVIGAGEGVMNIIAGASSGNVMAIIQGAVQLFGEVAKWIDWTPQAFKNIKNIIEETEAKMEEYGDEYSKLQREVSKATGQALDATNKKLAENLRLQITQLQSSIMAMEAELADAPGSKDTSEYEDEIKEAKKQLKDLQNQLVDLMDDIVERTLGNKTVNSIMEDLATALVDAWAQGENAAEAYRDKVKDIVKDIARNMIIQNLITDEFTKMLTNYTDNWDENTSWEDKMNDIDAWYQEAMNYSDEMMEAMNGMSDKWKEWLTTDTEASGLSGAIKGMSQESADLLAGVANAMRLNQAAIINSLSEILIQTTGIRTNTATANSRLNDIYREIQASASSVNRAERILGSPHTNTYAQ